MRILNLVKFFLGLSLLLESSSWAFKDEIEKLEKSIVMTRTAYKKDPVQSINTLLKLSKTFDVLEGEEQAWSQLIAERKVYKWKNQTAKQAIGGHLFYPSNVDDLLDSRYTAYLLDRNDMIWSFALAAKYEDPRGEHYLSYLLAKIREDHDNTQQVPPFLKDLYKKAQSTFLATITEAAAPPQAVYILAYEYFSGDIRLGLSQHDPAQAEEYFNRVKNSHKEINGERERSEFQLLRMRTTYAKGFYNGEKPPEIKDYEKLHKFGPALVEAAALCKKHEEKKSFLEKAINNQYHPAHISLGLWYHQKKDNNFAEKSFLSAAEYGITAGYIKAGVLRVGDASAKTLQKLYPSLNGQQLTEEENVKKAIEYFEAAGKEADPQGWEFFVSVYESLHHIVKNLEKENIPNRESQLEKFTLKIKDGIEKGLSLGAASAHRRLKSYTPRLFSQKDSENLIKLYGKPPYENLWEDIKDFIEKGEN